MSSKSDGWSRYYQLTKSNRPHRTLLAALRLFAAEDAGPGFAVDLGCGSGRDTVELLRRGWRVLAIDQEPDAFDVLLNDAHSRYRDSLETCRAKFEEASWPAANLVNASLSLPLCSPENFARVWLKIRQGILPGGRFAGHFLGMRDDWAKASSITHHTREEIENILSGFEVEILQERESDEPTAREYIKHWHIFHVVARAPR